MATDSALTDPSTRPVPRIFLTGATGCVGSRVALALAAIPAVELTLLVRDTSRVHPALLAHPRVRCILGDLRDVRSFAHDVPGVDALVLAATSWGEHADAVDVAGVLRLVDLVAGRGAHVVYFSTASVLDRDGSPLAEAATIGTPYIRAKLAATRALLARTDVATTVIYPTLVVGGGQAPPSQVDGLLRQVAERAWLLRFFSAEASFHLVHAGDLATLVVDALAHPPAVGAPREIVAGGPPVTGDELVEAVLRAAGVSRLARVPINGAVAETLIRAFKVQLAPWDRFCFARRHFTYDRALLPSALGLPDAYGSLDALLGSTLRAPAIAATSSTA